nr:MAG TPA: hypothetical protein [Caudoviricetes sp.]
MISSLLDSNSSWPWQSSSSQSCDGCASECAAARCVYYEKGGRM